MPCVKATVVSSSGDSKVTVQLAEPIVNATAIYLTEARVDLTGVTARGVDIQFVTSNSTDLRANDLLTHDRVTLCSLPSNALGGLRFHQQYPFPGLPLVQLFKQKTSLTDIQFRIRNADTLSSEGWDFVTLTFLIMYDEIPLASGVSQPTSIPVTPSTHTQFWSYK